MNLINAMAQGDTKVGVTDRLRNFMLDGEGERRMHGLLNSLPVAIYTTDLAGRITFYNEAAAALWGCRPKLNCDQWCGSWKLYWPDGTPLPHDECPMAIAIKEQRAINGTEAVAERPDGTRVPFMAFPSPLFNSAGEAIGAVNMLVDITERTRSEELSQKLASIVESSDDAIISKDLNGIIATWNKGAERLFGYLADEAIGKPVMMLIPIERHDEEPMIIARLCRGERIDHYETVRRRKDGSLVEISLTVSPIRDTQGRVVGASKIARDITERKLAQERIQLLAREVDHRSKNLLALVQATVHLSNADSPQALKEVIEGRLHAISNAHSLFPQSRWLGADLRKLVEEELAPYGRQRAQRAEFDGPELMLDPASAQSIAIVLHELTTNAVKYGALSGDAGKLKVEWSLRRDDIAVVRWTETGGPPAKKPERRGFGTRVMEQLIRGQVGGRMHFDWRPTGLVCEIILPLREGHPVTAP